MEKNLTATFHSVESLEHAVDELRRQDVLHLNFDHGHALKVEYQANSLVQSLEAYPSPHVYTLEVSVEKSRYRQAEDTIVKHGGMLYGAPSTY